MTARSQRADESRARLVRVEGKSDAPLTTQEQFDNLAAAVEDLKTLVVTAIAEQTETFKTYVSEALSTTEVRVNVPVDVPVDVPVEEVSDSGAQ